MTSGKRMSLVVLGVAVFMIVSPRLVDELILDRREWALKGFCRNKIFFESNHRIFYGRENIIIDTLTLFSEWLTGFLEIKFQFVIFSRLCRYATNYVTQAHSVETHIINPP